MDKELIGHTIIENKTYAVGNDKKNAIKERDLNKDARRELKMLNY